MFLLIICYLFENIFFVLSFKISISVFIFVCAGSLLPCGFFSVRGEQVLFSSCGVRLTSHCNGSSCWGSWALGNAGFRSHSSQAPEHRLSSCGTRRVRSSPIRCRTCLLHRQSDSLSLSHQTSAVCYQYCIIF